jgi:membrane-bound ClpP family serine protease
MQGFDPTIIDPNFIYIALLAGLWIGVAAVYVPGTWIPELGSIALIVGSLLVLTLFPTNWIAVFVLVLGVSTFLILPIFGEKWARFAEIGLVFQAFGAYFLFEGNPVSLILIAFTLALGFAYNRLVLIPIMHSQGSRTEFDEANQVLGIRGRVVKDLNPVGTIYVNKELWRARSDEYLAKDTHIMVIAQDGLELIVEKAKTEDTPSYQSLAN